MQRNFSPLASTHEVFGVLRQTFGLIRSRLRLVYKKLRVRTHWFIISPCSSVTTAFSATSRRSYATTFVSSVVTSVFGFGIVVSIVLRDYLL